MKLVSFFLMITALFIIMQPSTFAAKKCDAKIAEEYVNKACAIVNANPDPKVFIPKVEALTFCDGNYVWVQTRKKDTYQIVAHRVSPALKKKKEWLPKVMSKLKLFELLNDAGLDSSGKKWVAYKWKSKDDLLNATKKLSLLKKCNNDWAAGSGIWLKNCAGCPKIDYGKKYIVEKK